MITFLTQPSELIVVGLRPGLSAFIALQRPGEDLWWVRTKYGLLPRVSIYRKTLLISTESCLTL